MPCRTPIRLGGAWGRDLGSWSAEGSLDGRDEPRRQSSFGCDQARLARKDGDSGASEILLTVLRVWVRPDGPGVRVVRQPSHSGSRILKTRTQVVRVVDAGPGGEIYRGLVLSAFGAKSCDECESGRTLWFGTGESGERGGFGRGTARILWLSVLCGHVVDAAVRYGGDGSRTPVAVNARPILRGDWTGRSGLKAIGERVS
jgi:hypothetical protein